MKTALRPAAPAVLQWHPMTVSDLDRVMLIEAGAYSFPWTRGNFIDSLAAGYAAEMLADAASGDVVGYYVAMPGVDELHLLNLTVSPPYQGRGHARALLAAVEAAARRRGLGTLWLEVRVSNERALRLYERHGFHRAGQRRGYYPAAGGQREDAVVMTLPLLPSDEEGGDALG
jgi:ribosomal-protein-alanine N-acetyltransferase